MAGSIVRHSDDVIGIDLHFQGVQNVISPWLVRGKGGWVIVDCGPATGYDAIIDGLRMVGLEIGDVERIVLTHIHLDHAGGSGKLLRDHGHVRVSVHADAAQFLVDPTRLVKSATISFGDRMETLWGEVIPVPADRIDPLQPDDVVPGTHLRAIGAPGHTGTHLAYLDRQSGVLFTGDSAHARVPGSSVIVPTLVPVELDFDLWQRTADQLIAQAPSALALAHAGLFTDAGEHLDQIMERIRDRVAIAERILESPDDIGRLESALYAATVAELTAEGGDVAAKLESLELSMPSYLGAQGLVRWFKVQGRFQT